MDTLPARDNSRSNNPHRAAGPRARIASRHAHPATPDATARVVQPAPADLESTRECFKQKTGISLCAWQAYATLVCNAGERDLFLLAPPGAGKTMAFLAPLIFNPHRIVLIVCPLLALGSQHYQTCTKLGIPAVELTLKTASDANFHVGTTVRIASVSSNRVLLQDIALFKFQAIIAPPEVVNLDPRFLKLIKTPSFADKLIRLITDECHCIMEWSDFRPQYLNFDLILHWLPPHVRKLCASATVTDSMRKDIMRYLRLSLDDTELIRLNND